MNEDLADATLNLLLKVGDRNLDRRHGTPLVMVSRRELQNLRAAFDREYPGVLRAAREARDQK